MKKITRLIPISLLILMFVLSGCTSIKTVQLADPELIQEINLRTKKRQIQITLHDGQQFKGNNFAMSPDSSQWESENNKYRIQSAEISKLSLLPKRQAPLVFLGMAAGAYLIFKPAGPDEGQEPSINYQLEIKGIRPALYGFLGVIGLIIGYTGESKYFYHFPNNLNGKPITGPVTLPNPYNDG